MNKLLKKAFEKAAELPDEKQETLAAIILEEMDSDEKWDGIDGDARWEELFARPESQILLERMADKALKEIQEGKSKPLSPSDS